MCPLSAGHLPRVPLASLCGRLQWLGGRRWRRGGTLAAMWWLMLVQERRAVCPIAMLARLILVIGLGVLSPECFLLAPETNFSPDLLPGK